MNCAGGDVGVVFVDGDASSLLHVSTRLEEKRRNAQEKTTEATTTRAYLRDRLKRRAQRRHSRQQSNRDSSASARCARSQFGLYPRLLTTQTDALGREDGRVGGSERAPRD